MRGVVVVLFVVSVAVSQGVSFLCSLLEAVLFSTRVISLEAAMEGGSSAAAQMLGLKARMERTLSAILILNTLAHTGGASIAGWAAGDLWGADSLFIFSVLFTLSTLVFTEILPKTLGTLYWRGLWPWAVTPLKIMIVGLTPLIWLTQLLTRVFTRKGQATASPHVSEQEILAAASMGQRGGEISQMEAELIHNIIGLEEISASDIMTPRTVMKLANGALNVSQILPEARKWSYSRLPVYVGDPENIVGYVLRDHILATDPARHDPKVSELARPLHFVPASANALRLLKHFLSRRAHMCVVVDEYGGVDGLVTMEDVLESLVGAEIVDETDQVVDMQELARRRAKDMLAGREEQKS
ncbi:protein of unknown function DUF21 [Desulfarculus baarsii DSM 2075]|uniref:CBS domain containing protein n=1 Tax=Desulfarculus baarsii (strain ATCC 33931 / DSM 2075 / LMG 7858 / VKM B-1802 / 2st14) TaxID=644282 RepID=E1QET0_DESB2|nr:protein of unknown function DUF21 [Desulfarculus baarsii DSM 2075]